MRRGFITAVLLFLMAPLGGCYTYTPVDVHEVAPGTGVRARVSSDAARRLEGTLGSQGRELKGEVVEAGPDGLTLMVRSAIVPQGVTVRQLRQQVTLAPGDLVELEQRRLDKKWTFGLATVGAAGIGYLLVQQFTQSAGEPSEEGDRSSADNIVVPLLRWTIGGP